MTQVVRYRHAGILATAAVTAWSVLLIGLCFHTSENPSILGKYSARYLLTLLVVAALAPLVYFAVRWLFTTHIVQMRSGDWLSITTGLKCKALLALAAVTIFISEAALLLISGNQEAKLEKFDPYLQVVPARNDEGKHINRWGFRGEDIELAKPAGSFRIFYLGGSTVFCARAEWEDSHPRILEKKLRAHYPDRRIEVQNAAMEWHSTQHSLVKLQTKVEDFQPNLVILYHAMNDLYRSLSHPRYSLGAYRRDYSHFYGPLEGMVNAYRSSRVPIKLVSLSGAYSHLERHLLTKWFSDFRRREMASFVDVNQWESLESYERNLRNIAGYLSRKGVGLVLASQPYLYKAKPNPQEESQMEIPARILIVDGRRISMESIVRGMEMFNDTSRRIADELGVDYIDLEGIVPKETSYFYDGIHYTTKGNALVGGRMAEFLIERGLLDRRAASVAGNAQEPPGGQAAASN